MHQEIGDLVIGDLSFRSNLRQKNVSIKTLRATFWKL